MEAAAAQAVFRVPPAKPKRLAPQMMNQRTAAGNLSID